jgi:hypothetical protein
MEKGEKIKIEGIDGKPVIAKITSLKPLRAEYKDGYIISVENPKIIK